MSKARKFGPVLMMLVGVALLFAPTPAASSLDVGSTKPCYEMGAAQGLQAQPIPSRCCGTYTVGVVIPCPTITLDPGATTEPPATEPPATEPPATEPQATSTTMIGETTTTAAVNAGGVVKSGTLARTGSNSGTMTIAGLSLLALGAGLAIAGRRRSAQA